MLPPPFDESQIHSLRPHHDPVRVQTPASEQQSRAASQASTRSTESSIARKPPPPIPKKPTLLTRPSNSGSISQNKATTAEKISMSRSPPTINNASPRLSVSPRQMTGPVSTGAYSVQQRPGIASPAQGPGQVDGPPLPPRRTGTGVASPNGLMDEDNEGASAIPSLQPSRRN